MDREHRLRRLKFRAWHRGTKEADLLIGGFYERYGAGWDEAGIAWFEALLEEQDVDVIGWAFGTIAVPEHWQGPWMEALKRLDYVGVAAR